MGSVAWGAPCTRIERPTEKKDTRPPAHLRLRHRMYQRPPSNPPNNRAKPAPSQGPPRPRDPTPPPSPYLEHTTFTLSLPWRSTSTCAVSILSVFPGSQAAPPSCLSISGFGCVLREAIPNCVIENITSVLTLCPLVPFPALLPEVALANCVFVRLPPVSPTQTWPL